MYGGTTGIRDIDMLNSALESPFQTWGGKDLCKTLEEKAIHLCFSVVVGSIITRPQLITKSFVEAIEK